MYESLSALTSDLTAVRKRIDNAAMEMFRGQPDELVVSYSIYLGDLNLFGIDV